MTIQQLHLLFLNSKGVCTDTRKLKEGQLYFALKGANFNGNLFRSALYIKCLQSAAPDTSGSVSKIDYHIL